MPRLFHQHLHDRHGITWSLAWRGFLRIGIRLQPWKDLRILMKHVDVELNGVNINVEQFYRLSGLICYFIQKHKYFYSKLIHFETPVPGIHLNLDAKP